MVNCTNLKIIYSSTKIKLYTQYISVELQESNVRLKLTIVDSVGFGDQINKEDSYKPIVEYINQQFENYLQVFG